jgi:hypothetical protein
MKKTYLSPAGREWLKSKQAQNASAIEMITELLTHEGGVLRPPRKRGRPLKPTLRIDDRIALVLLTVRHALAFFKKEPFDYKESLRDIAKELDARTGWEGEPDARYRRLQRVRVEPGLVEMLMAALLAAVEHELDMGGPDDPRSVVQIVGRVEKEIWDGLSPDFFRSIQEKSHAEIYAMMSPDDLQSIGHLVERMAQPTSGPLSADAQKLIQGKVRLLSVNNSGKKNRI